MNRTKIREAGKLRSGEYGDEIAGEVGFEGDDVIALIVVFRDERALLERDCVPW